MEFDVLGWGVSSSRLEVYKSLSPGSGQSHKPNIRASGAGMTIPNPQRRTAVGIPEWKAKERVGRKSKTGESVEDAKERARKWQAGMGRVC